ncbi:MAG: universal stress protein [Halobacteriota archaeon]
MTTFVLGTNDVNTSAALCDYLQERVGPGDVVYAVNSLRGGDETSSDEVRDGSDALNVVEVRLGASATVETHQFVRDNSPVEDLLACVADADADELVIGLRTRSPTAKIVFGSTAQDVLLRANVPIAVVPLEPA